MDLYSSQARCRKFPLASRLPCARYICIDVLLNGCCYVNLIKTFWFIDSAYKPTLNRYHKNIPMSTKLQHKSRSSFMNFHLLLRPSQQSPYDINIMRRTRNLKILNVDVHLYHVTFLLTSPARPSVRDTMRFRLFWSSHQILPSRL